MFARIKAAIVAWWGRELEEALGAETVAVVGRFEQRIAAALAAGDLTPQALASTPAVAGRRGGAKS